MTDARKSWAKLHFHVVLPSLLCPGVGVPLAWTLAIINLFARIDSPEHRRWTRRLVGLAAFDTAVLLLFLLASFLRGGGGTDVSGLGGWMADGGASPRRIGVVLQPGTSPPEIASLARGYPAEDAGLRVGDRIVSVNGQPVTDGDEARRRIAATPAEQDVTLEVMRGGVRLTFQVPAVTRPPEEATRRGLFEPDATDCMPMARTGVPWGLLVAALVVGGLYVAGRRHGMDASIVWAAVLLLVVAAGTEAAALGICGVVGGPSRGGLMLALFVQTLLLLCGGLLLWHRLRRRLPAGEPGRPWYTVALLGVLYLLGGGTRVAVLLLVAGRLLGAEPAPFADSPLHSVGSSGLGLTGALLFVLPVAILGPVAEEVLFRGVVLPWLAGWMKQTPAVLLTAALFAMLHLYYGPFVLVIFVYGAVLGWARIASGGLKAPIALHVAINGFASAVLLLTGAKG